MPETLAELFGMAFPAPDDVAHAAVRFPYRPAVDGQSRAWVREAEDWRDPGRLAHNDPLRLADRRRVYLAIGPGVVRLRTHDPARAERSRERVDSHRLHYVDQLALADEVWTEARQAEIAARPVRGRIMGWSAKSRSRMTYTIAALDFGPLMALVEAGRMVAPITLTYPGDWLAAAPDRAAVNKHLEAFYSAYQRAWGESWLGLWKFEFQRRGAPHWLGHCAPPHGLARGGQGDGLPFMAWLSLTWANIVSYEGQDPLDYANHLAAGTNVDWKAGARYRDPRRVAVYFSKHGQFRGKEYQNHPPDEWMGPGKSCGRFWGRKGLRLGTAEFEIDPVHADGLARVLRRWCRAQDMMREVRAPRARGGMARPADRVVVGLAGKQLLDAHRVRKRKVRRRARYLRRGAGFVVVNDGPAMAAALARLVS